jgi:hypothetical protein
MRPARALTVFWTTLLLAGLVYFLVIGALRR